LEGIDERRTASQIEGNQPLAHGSNPFPNCLGSVTRPIMADA
jgi:hypothetical protein